jgi:hypothetical protein
MCTLPLDHGSYCTEEGALALHPGKLRNTAPPSYHRYPTNSSIRIPGQMYGKYLVPVEIEILAPGVSPITVARPEKSFDELASLFLR